MPRINAATRCAGWWAVLLMVFTLPFIPQYQEASTVIMLAAPGAAGAEAPVVPAATAPAQMTSTPASWPPLADVPEVSAPASWLPLGLPDGFWLVGILLVWSALFAFRMGHVVRSFKYLSGVKRRARPAAAEQRQNFDAWVLACHVDRPVRLLVSNEITSPIAVGFRNPAVIVPAKLAAELADSDFDHVLLHELAHVVRRDDWTNLAAKILGAMLILHPVAVWVAKRIERDREIACDDWVVCMTGDARSYAASLARLFELCHVQPREILAAGMANHGSTLGRRIEVLLRTGRDFVPEVSVGRVWAGVLMLVTVVAVGSQLPPWIAFAQESPDLLTRLTPPAVPVQAASPAPAANPASQATAPPNPQQPAAAAPQAPQAPQAATPTVPPLATSSGSFLADLAALGYTGLEVDDIVALKIHGVTPAYIQQMNQAGWGRLTAEQLVSIRIHGVTPEYMQSMKDLGLTVNDLDDLVAMKIHGLDAAYVREMRSLGLNLEQDDLVSFKIHGVDPAYVQKMRSIFPTVTADEIISMKIHGVD
jgi:beta-lactamase regulating signal transducer with metallopeptidase domain